MEGSGRCLIELHSQHLTVGTVEYHWKRQRCRRPWFERLTSRIQVGSFITWADLLCDFLEKRSKYFSRGHHYTSYQEGSTKWLLPHHMFTRYLCWLRWWGGIKITRMWGQGRSIPWGFLWPWDWKLNVPTNTCSFAFGIVPTTWLVTRIKDRRVWYFLRVHNPTWIRGNNSHSSLQ